MELLSQDGQVNRRSSAAGLHGRAALWLAVNPAFHNCVQMQCNRINAILCALLTAGFFPSISQGAKLGDPAAPLVIKDWVKGKPVDVKDGKSIYVVEFWATWCGPCKQSIPHLTELQTKFKDKVVFVGISDEVVGTVKPFVEKMGKQMDYVVACDDERKSNAAYMQAYGQGGIPTAFVVDRQGNLAWFGHPMDQLEEILNQVLAGKYDINAASKRDEERALQSEFQGLSAKGDQGARELGRKLMERAGEDVTALTQFAFNVAANIQNQNRDFSLANEALDKAEKLAGGKDSRVLGVRSIVRFESGKEEEGLALAKEAVTLAKDDAEKKKYEYYLRVMETRRAQKAKVEKSPAPEPK